MVVTEKYVQINGNKWKLIGDETSTGAAYKMSDVIECGGSVPHYVSVESVTCTKHLPTENEWFKNKIKNKR